jgi:hypothetical protein
MQRMIGLAAVALAAWLVLSISLDDGPANDLNLRLVDVSVLNGTMILVPAEKSPTTVETWVVDGDAVRLLVNAEGTGAIDVVVSVNSRTNLGTASAEAGGRSMVIEVELPAPGSQWAVPGPGVSSPRQTITVSGDEVFLLQVAGRTPAVAFGDASTSNGQMLRVMRAQ